MQATDRTLSVVFDLNIRLMVPLFQRPYVWEKEENWVPLWESVETVSDRRLRGDEPRPHFLGAIVLDRAEMPTGEVQARQVIDGQQRLTTLQILLASIRDLCKARRVDNYHGAFKRLTENYVTSKKIPESVYKVWPTNRDRSAFTSVMSSGSLSSLLQAFGVKKAAKLENHMCQAYAFFYDAVDGWLGDARGEGLEQRLEALLAAVREDIVLVVVDLGEKDDAQLIFETMNALMTPLLPSDLVKNLLFRRAGDQGIDTQSLYDRYWAPFDNEAEFWRREVRQGRLTRHVMDIFLQYYLTLRKREDIGIGHLYTEFKSYLGTNGCGAVEGELIRLREYGDVYRSLAEFPLTSREGLFFYRLEQLDTQTVIPVLLEVFKSPDNEADRALILDYLESYLVRRAVCGLTYKAYNRLFVDLIRRLSEVGFVAAEVRDFLLTREGESSRWPDDKEFADAVTISPLYNSLKRARLRMFLEGIESAMHDKKAEKVVLNDKLTIEHIMPRKWRENWESPAGDDKDGEDLRDHIIHTVGNLTLLTQELNSAQSNAAWAEKKKALLKHSVLTMNRCLESHEVWDEKAIMTRGMTIAALAKRIWPRPTA